MRISIWNAPIGKTELSFQIFVNGRQPMQPARNLKKGGSRDGAVVRALASHQCGTSSIPDSRTRRHMCRLSLLLVLVLAPRGFSPGSLVSPSPQKPTLLNFNWIWKDLFLFIFIYFIVTTYPWN